MGEAKNIYFTCLKSSFCENINSTMSYWPQPREVSVALTSDHGKEKFGCIQSQRMDWHVIWESQNEKAKGIVLWHLPIHQTRIKEVSIFFHKDERLIKRSETQSLKAEDASKAHLVLSESFACLTTNQRSRSSSNTRSIR